MNKKQIVELQAENAQLKKQWTDVPDDYANWREVAEYFMELDDTKCTEFAKIMDERDTALAREKALQREICESLCICRDRTPWDSPQDVAKSRGWPGLFEGGE